MRPWLDLLFANGREVSGHVVIRLPGKALTGHWRPA